MPGPYKYLPGLAEGAKKSQVEKSMRLALTQSFSVWGTAKSSEGLIPK